MVASTTTVTTKVASGSPYQLENGQVIRASSALLRHMKSEQQQREESSAKKNLLADNDDASDSDGTGGISELVWLVLTTKKHVVDKNRLKPGKISIPYSLNTSSSLSICLITADPQRSIKDIVTDPLFPTSLSSRINKIIGFSKLKARYQSFETRRQLLSEHDVFLADDRIIMRLVDILGKVFYKSSKRPIPVRVEQINKVDGKRVKKDSKRKLPKDERHSAFASPLVVAKEVEKALNCTPVHLAPATTTAIRVGSTNLTPEQLAENVEAVVTGLTDRFITKGWRNVKAIHIKGPNTMAMPIWLASELWVDETDVIENSSEQQKAIEGAKIEKKKRKSPGDGRPSEETRKPKKSRTADDDEDIARKEKLQKQKAKALEEGSVPTVKAISNGGSNSSKKKRKSIS